MLKLRLSLMAASSILFLLLGVGVNMGLKELFLEHYFAFYPAIPLFFYLLSIIFISIITNSEKKDPRKLTNLYMLLKYSKILFSLLFCGFYFLFSKVQIRDFSVIFAGFYFVYLALETYIFYCTEKEIKKNTLNEKLT